MSRAQIVPGVRVAIIRKHALIFGTVVRVKPYFRTKQVIVSVGGGKTKVEFINHVAVVPFEPSKGTWIP